MVVELRYSEIMDIEKYLGEIEENAQFVGLRLVEQIKQLLIGKRWREVGEQIMLLNKIREIAICAIDINYRLCSAKERK